MGAFGPVKEKERGGGVGVWFSLKDRHSLSIYRERKQQHPIGRAALEKSWEKREKKEGEEEEKKEKKDGLLFEDPGRALFVKNFVDSKSEVGGILLNIVWDLEIWLKDDLIRRILDFTTVYPEFALLCSFLQFF